MNLQTMNDRFAVVQEVSPICPDLALPRPTQADVEAAVRTLIAATGDDPHRQGLIDTPARVARAYGEWFAGYQQEPSQILSRTFDEAQGYREMVLLRSIPLVSRASTIWRRLSAKRISPIGLATAWSGYRSSRGW